MNRPESMRILMITSEWPTPASPHVVPFVVQQAAYLREAGVDVQVFPFQGRMNPLNYLKAWIQCRRRFQMDRFDLIHAQFGQSGLLALPTPVPLVVTYWGSDLHGFIGSDGRFTRRGRILQRVSRFVAKRAAEVILVSEHLSQFLPPRMPHHVIAHGVDLNRFRPMDRQKARRQLDLPADKPLVLFGSHPNNPIKRFALAQKAVQELEKHLDIEMIPLLGVSHDQVPLFMNACDVLLFTSRHEGSPTVVKEAMACNLPIVSVDVGDVRQRISSVRGCILCEEDTPRALAAGLRTVLQSRECRTQSRAAIQELDENRVIGRILEVYRSAIASQASLRASTP